MKASIIWDPSVVEYRFGPEHPFNPKRLELTVSLIEEMGLLSRPGLRMEPPRPATWEELVRIHDPAFVKAVMRLSEEGADLAEAARWGLGTEDTPVFPGMHQITSLVVGATLRAAEMVMEGDVLRSFSVAGGLHHAHRRFANGFCVYSDLGAAIAWLRQKHDARVLYFDFDAHHGDGVQALFYEDPNVLTFSIHQTGRFLFPGTGFVEELGEGDGHGFSLNVPLEPFTEDESWIQITESLFPEIARAFDPDVMIIQCGCDGHALDPLTHLRASTRLYEETMRIVTETADEVCGGRIVATGGGGYDVWRVVPRAWTLVWAGLTGQDPPDEIPAAWLDRWSPESPVELPTRLRDDPSAIEPVERRADIERINERSAMNLRSCAIPLIRGWGFGF